MELKLSHGFGTVSRDCYGPRRSPPRQSKGGKASEGLKAVLDDCSIKQCESYVELMKQLLCDATVLVSSKSNPSASLISPLQVIAIVLICQKCHAT